MKGDQFWANRIPVNQASPRPTCTKLLSPGELQTKRSNRRVVKMIVWKVWLNHLKHGIFYQNLKNHGYIVGKQPVEISKYQDFPMIS